MRPCPEDVRAAMRWREEKARKPLAFGHVKDAVLTLYLFCSWCERWIGPEPEPGEDHETSHGICRSCADKTLEEADA